MVEGAVNCAAASASAERSSDRCPALPHRLAAFSISPASSAMTREKLGLVLRDFRELALECFCDAGVKRPSRLAQQRAWAAS